MAAAVVDVAVCWAASNCSPEEERARVVFSEGMGLGDRWFSIAAPGAGGGAWLAAPAGFLLTVDAATDEATMEAVPGAGLVVVPDGTKWAPLVGLLTITDGAVGNVAADIDDAAVCQIYVCNQTHMSCIRDRDTGVQSC